MFPLLPLPYKIIASLMLAAALVIGYKVWEGRQQAIGEAKATTRHNAMIQAQKIEAGRVLAQAVALVEKNEADLRKFKDDQEVKDANNKKTTDNLKHRLRDLAGPAGRLRDPNADDRCGDGGGVPQGGTTAGAGHSGDNGAEGGGLLSTELSGLLQRLTAEADEINTAYASCRADSLHIREGLHGGR